MISWTLAMEHHTHRIIVLQDNSELRRLSSVKHSGLRSQGFEGEVEAKGPPFHRSWAHSPVRELGGDVTAPTGALFSQLTLFRVMNHPSMCSTQDTRGCSSRL